MANDPIPADKQACKNCRFSKPRTWDPLICCRMPPQIVPCPDSAKASEWPEVCEEDWCGEWQERV